ncbi:MAG TPA: argininosuccinate lyase [Candidatus Cybelea sp.]|nr:argininosuccinate lyase [Candidatus Cybelea sp.]
MSTLQWGGRFAEPPDPQLLAFGSSLEEDLVLAPFDVDCSRAHVAALLAGGVIDQSQAAALQVALQGVCDEINDGSFAQAARAGGFEDVHGAVDARVRELAGDDGEWLHAGRSRNDQVATTLLLYVRERARSAARATHAIAGAIGRGARSEFEAGTLVAACTHRQPAQPALLAFLLIAWCEPFVRATARFLAVRRTAAAACPLGSAALAGSSLPLDRMRATDALAFAAPSRNALDAIGNRDAALDLAHACVRATIDASRIAEELIMWSTPAYGYVALGDAASTGSSLMPQKRNPDPFELVRARAAQGIGRYAGALGTLCGLAPSYQRDLQIAKSQIISIVEDGLRTLDAFARAFGAVTFVREKMERGALDGYTIATDIADALIARGVTARTAHALVGAAVARAETERRPLGDADLSRLADESGIESLHAPLDARASVEAKQTRGSTSPDDVRRQLAALESELANLRTQL